MARKTSDETDSTEGNSDSVPAQSQDGKLSRRNILRSTSAIGSAAFLLTIPALAEKSGFGTERALKNNQGSLESVYQSLAVQQLREQYPNVALEPRNIRTVVTDSEDKVVAANVTVEDGELTYISVHDTTQVTLVFDERDRDVVGDWPSDTEGLINATSNGATFVRTATVDELETVLNSLGRTEVEDADEQNVYVAPETQSYFVEKFDYESRQLELLEVSSQLDALGETGYRIDDQDVYGTKGATIQGGCNINDDTAANVLLCLHQVTTCSACSPSFLGGPIPAVACLLLVCIGTPTALEALIDELDNSCVALVTDVLSCWDEWTDFY